MDIDDFLHIREKSEGDQEEEERLLYYIEYMEAHPWRLSKSSALDDDI